MWNLVAQISTHKVYCKQTLATVCVHVSVRGCASLILQKRLAVTGPKIGCFLIRAFPRHTSFSPPSLVAFCLTNLCLLLSFSFFLSFFFSLSVLLPIIYVAVVYNCFALGGEKKRYHNSDKDVSSPLLTPLFLRHDTQTHMPTALGQYG